MVRTARAHRAALRTIAIPLRESATSGRTKHMNFHNSAALKKIRVKRGTSQYKGTEKKVCRVAPTDHRQING
jgi:hypothetical protein